VVRSLAFPLLVAGVAGCLSDCGRGNRGGVANGPDAGGPPPGPTPLEQLCSLAPEVCGRLRSTAGENLLLGKLRLEAELAERSAHRFVCAAIVGDCIAAYAGLLSLDWSKSRLAKHLPVFLSADAPSATADDHAVLSLHESPAHVASLLGATPAPAPEVVTEMLARLDVAPPSESPGCDSSRAFYDRLFANDEIEATIAFGYLDRHLDSIVGYLRYSLLKLDPIPVFLRSQDSFLATTRTRFRDHGFTEEAHSRTELRLSRRFYYRGRLKTLRVHVVFSVARCPDEAPDEYGRLWRYDDQTCAEQRRATARAKAALAGAFATSSVILYNGHARFGRGLDFGPLGLDEGKLQLDCRALPCDRGGPAQNLLFVNACDTVSLYGASAAELRRQLPVGHALAWLGNRGDVQMENAPQTSLRLMNLLVEARCPQEIIAVLNLPKQYPEENSRVEGEGF
jgi:hypothetical protein